jgi:flagellar basal-body rod protein FlgB
MASSIIFGPPIKILEMAIDLRAQRHEQIAANIANLDTPGYKSHHLSFEEQLNRIPELVETESSRMTQKRHFPLREANIHSNTFPRVESSDTVSLEKEITKLGENNLMYNALAQILKGAFAKLRLAIREGR